MANGDNSNLVQEFEEAFQKCLTSLTEEDDLYHKDSEVWLTQLQYNVSIKCISNLVCAERYRWKSDSVHRFGKVPSIFLPIRISRRPGQTAGDVLPSEKVPHLQPQAGDDPEGGHRGAESRTGAEGRADQVSSLERVERWEMRVRCVLCRKHYEKLGKWKEMLADAQVSCQSVVFHCSVHSFIC